MLKKLKNYFKHWEYRYYTWKAKYWKKRIEREFPDFLGLAKDPNNKLPISMFYMEIGPGWYRILYEYLKEFRHRDIKLEITQIKEKYGTLRVYYSYSRSTESDKTFETCCNLDDRYEEISGRTCDICGREGELNEGGWLRARCKRHEGL